MILYTRVPRPIFSDQCPNFKSKRSSESCETLKTLKTHITLIEQQTDRKKGTLREDFQQQEWDLSLVWCLLGADLQSMHSPI